MKTVACIRVPYACLWNVLSPRQLVQGFICKTVWRGGSNSLAGRGVSLRTHGQGKFTPKKNCTRSPSGGSVPFRAASPFPSQIGGQFRRAQVTSVVILWFVFADSRRVLNRSLSLSSCGPGRLETWAKWQNWNFPAVIREKGTLMVAEVRRLSLPFSLCARLQVCARWGVHPGRGIKCWWSY